MPQTAPHELQTLLSDVYDKHRDNTSGNVATYIPELSKVNPDEFGVCVVTANGQVFEAGDCERLFTRFFRTEDAARRAVAGAGLGLSITKDIVESHGGRIDVVSTIGQGSVFRVRMPR